MTDWYFSRLSYGGWTVYESFIHHHFRIIHFFRKGTDIFYYLKRTIVLLKHFILLSAKMDTSVLGGGIPGLDDDDSKSTAGDILKKKVPYAKPVPKMFEAAWESGVQPFEKDASKPPMGQQRPPPPPGT